METPAINSKAVEFIQLMIGEHTKIYDLNVQGKWLIATLPNNMRVWTLNRKR